MHFQEEDALEGMHFQEEDDEVSPSGVKVNVPTGDGRIPRSHSSSSAREKFPAGASDEALPRSHSSSSPVHRQTNDSGEVLRRENSSPKLSAKDLAAVESLPRSAEGATSTRGGPKQGEDQHRGGPMDHSTWFHRVFARFKFVVLWSYFIVILGVSIGVVNVLFHKTAVGLEWWWVHDSLDKWVGYFLEIPNV